MMTKEMMINKVNELGEDVGEFYTIGNELHINLDDFEGFDEDWSEIDREYDDEETVSAFIKMLEAECSSKKGGLYMVYYFEDFSVVLGYTSFDI